jgi:RND family efflux transporter MFP subunit
MVLQGCGNSNADIQAEKTLVPRPVKVMTVKEDAKTEIRSFPGIVKAAREIDLAFRVGGPLVEYDLNIGAIVRKGETIARIDPRDFKNRVQKLSAELKAAVARLSDAEKDYERQKRLLAENAASQAQYDKTQMIVETTRAGIESLKADIAAAENALDDTGLTAPFDGVVNRNFTDNHQTVSPGMPVVTLLDLSSLEVATSVPEDIVIRESDFRRIYATLDAHPGLELAAVLNEMGRQISNTNQSYPLTAVLKIPEDLTVEPGMAADVHIEIAYESEGETGLVLPTAAVFGDSEGISCVWRLGEDMETVKTPVKTGDLRGDDIVILSGVSAGDRVISAGARFLVEGQRVRILGDIGGSSS